MTARGYRTPYLPAEDRVVRAYMAGDLTGHAAAARLGRSRHSIYQRVQVLRGNDPSRRAPKPQLPAQYRPASDILPPGDEPWIVPPSIARLMAGR